MRQLKKKAFRPVLFLVFVTGTLTGWSETEPVIGRRSFPSGEMVKNGFPEPTETPLERLEERIAAQEKQLRLLKDELETLRKTGEKWKADEELRLRVKEIAAAEGFGNAGMKNGRFFIQSDDEKNRITVGGRIQPRFEYLRRENRDDITRFRFRRLRIDFQGHLIDENLTFRIMPELRDRAELDTAWVNYHVSDRIQIRAGQYNVPFSWERDVSSSRHQLTERSAANNAFQWPGGGGKDIGVTLHGKSSEKIRYSAGVFGGEGKNRSGESSEGVMLSGRAAWSPLGRYPNTETLLQPLEKTNLSFGAGAWYAGRNSVHDWVPQAAGNQSADAYAMTADGHFQIGRVSSHISGFFRRVDPEAGFSSYDGTGFTMQGGCLLVPDRLFAAVRYSEAAPDRKHDEGRKRELFGAFQIFHHGHRSKTHLETGWEQERFGNSWRDSQIVRIQYQLLF